MGAGRSEKETYLTRKNNQGDPMRIATISTAAAALMIGGLAATPALAASSNQVVAFTVADGLLAITPGTPATGVSSVLTGGKTTVTIDLGMTTVADTRVNSSGWSVSASTTDFTLTQAPGALSQVIAKTQAKFSVPLAPVSVLGSPAVTFARLDAPTAVDSTGGVASLIVATATGVNTGTFGPQLQITIPNGSAVGAYTGTITQTVV